MGIGALSGSRIGPELALLTNLANNGGPNTFAMAATTACFAARFQARVAKKPKNITLRWGTITAGGTVQLGVETIDAATGKPNAARTLYDANATYDITGTDLASGIKTYTFATPPAANVAVDTNYAVTLRTSVAGTAHPLISQHSDSRVTMLPAIALTSTDGGTTWAEVSNSVPCVVIVWDDDTCEEIGLTPFGGAVAILNVYSTVVAGQKIVIEDTISVGGIVAGLRLIGAPAGDLRCRIFDSAGIAITDAAVTVDKDMLLGSTVYKLHQFLFPSPINLSAGTYRVMFDSAASADSSNCWRSAAITFYKSEAVPAGYRSCTASDGTADSTTQISPIAFLLHSQTAGGGGGPVGGNMRGGFING